LQRSHNRRGKRRGKNLHPSQKEGEDFWRRPSCFKLRGEGEGGRAVIVFRGGKKKITKGGKKDERVALTLALIRREKRGGKEGKVSIASKEKKGKGGKGGRSLYQACEGEERKRKANHY